MSPEVLLSQIEECPEGHWKRSEHSIHRGHIHLPLGLHERASAWIWATSKFKRHVRTRLIHRNLALRQRSSIAVAIRAHIVEAVDKPITIEIPGLNAAARIDLRRNTIPSSNTNFE